MACYYLVVKLAYYIVPEFATAARGRGSAVASANDESSNFPCTKSSIELAILPVRSGAGSCASFGKSIYEPLDEQAELASHNVLEKCIEGRALTATFCTAACIIGVLARDFPMPCLRDSKEFVASIFGGLKTCADSGVNRDSYSAHWKSLDADWLAVSISGSAVRGVQPNRKS